MSTDTNELIYLYKFIMINNISAASKTNKFIMGIAEATWLLHVPKILLTSQRVWDAATGRHYIYIVGPNNEKSEAEARGAFKPIDTRRSG